MIGKTNAVKQGGGDSWTLVDTVVTTEAFSGNGSTVLGTFFPNFRPQSELFVLTVDGTISGQTALLLAAGNSIVTNGGVNFGLSSFYRNNGYVVGGSYTVSIAADTTLRLWSIDYSEKLPS